MTKKMNLRVRVTALAAASLAVVVMSGCNAGLQSTAPATLTISNLHGNVHGGRQPIIGAQMHLYAAFVNPNQTTPTYTGTNTDLLAGTTPVAGGTLTDANGNFNITGDYTCTNGQQMYMTSTGGDTGSTAVNRQAYLLIGLGDCSTISGGTRNIQMNEVTTAATATALSPYMYANSQTFHAAVTGPPAVPAYYSTDYSVGTSYNNQAGLARAFVNVEKLVDTGTGKAGGPRLAANATMPTSTLYNLADVLVYCVNSAGGTAPGGTSDGSNCGDLFALNTVTGFSPTDTIGMALAIAQNPTVNVASIWSKTPPGAGSPYVPNLSVSAPNDWTLSLSYSGFSAPKSTTVDGNGNIWVANSGNDTVTIVPSNGSTATTLSGNGLSTPAAVAIDNSGNAWVANSGAGTVSKYSNAGTFAASYTVGTTPDALAFDSIGNVWVANAGSNNITELSSAGATISTTSTVTSPTAVVINAK